MDRNFFTKHLVVFRTGFFIGFITFTLLITTLITWQEDGFSAMEVALMAILGGVYFFVVTLIVNIWQLNHYTYLCRLNDVKPLNRWLQVGIVWVLSFIIFLVLDWGYFMIDNSISIEFADALNQLMIANGKDNSGIEAFSNLPYSLQNGIVTLAFCFVASIISAPFIRKNSSLFATDHQYQ